MKFAHLKSILAGGVAIAALGAGAANAQELDIWTLNFGSDAQNQVLAEIAQQFEEAHPGVDVEITRRGTDEHKTALRVSAGTDSGPDIYFNWAGPGLGGEYVKSGLSMPLDEYYEQYGWSDRLVPAAEAFADLYPGGKHGVPESFRGEALYYDKELFAEAGIEEVPQTYDELIAAAEALKEAGIPAITFGGTVNWHVMRLMDALLETKCGAQTNDALMKMEADWSETQCATDAFAELKTWAENYFLTPFMGLDNNQAVDLFEAGRAAMMLEGNWLVNTVYERDMQDRIGVFPFPTGTGRLYGFGQAYYISTKSDVPDIAAEFLDYLISTEVQQANVSAFGSNPINSEVELTDLRPMDERWQEIFAEHSAMYVNGDQAFPAVIVPEYFRVINEVVSGGMEPDVAADTLQSFIDDNQ